MHSWFKVGVTVLGVGLMAALAPAQSLVVVDGQGSVANGVLELSGANCCTDTCQASFTLVNESDTTARDIAFATSPLLAADGTVVAATVRFEPPVIAKLGPAASRTVNITVTSPSGARSGRYLGTVTITAADGRTVSQTAGLVVCARAQSSLRIVAAEGDRSSSPLRFNGDECWRREVSMRLGLQAVGTASLYGVRVRIAGLSRAIAVAIEPELVDLAPSETVWVNLRLTLPENRRRVTFEVVAADALGSATARRDAVVERCQPPGLVIVKTESSLLSSTACGWGEELRGTVTVRNAGGHRLEAVSLRLSGVTGTSEVRPEQLALGLGQAAQFEVVATGAVGTMTVEAVDAATGVQDTVQVACDRDQVRPPANLAVRLTASRGVARVGQIVTFTATVENTGGGTDQVALVVELGRGLELVAGRSAIDGENAEAHRSRRRQIEYELGAVAAGQVREVRFQAAVTSKAELGPTRTVVEGVADGETVGPVAVTVEVTRMSLRPFGDIHGSVRTVAGVALVGQRIYLDSSRETATDAAGEFRFEGVLGGEHLVSLDPRLLPEGRYLREEDAQLLRLFDGESRQVEFVVGEGPMLRLVVERVPMGELASIEPE